jgi:hypothetical protein
MAAPPSTASPASWKPAVPPPPVTGAWVGMTSGLGVANSGKGLSLADVDGLDGWMFSLTGLSEVLELAVLALAVLVEEEVAPLAWGERVDTGVEELPVQAESATQTSVVARAQPRVSLTRCAVHAMAVRVLIEPPHALGNHHFPVAGRRNRCRKENVRQAFGR